MFPVKKEHFLGDRLKVDEDNREEVISGLDKEGDFSCPMSNFALAN